ncbi:high affinity immunoglobulin gamma Fc receptor I-like [Micropterus salmoides]|uniref:high affinity immunoglobulin gamma Fc receptor I-like n=1 Tax=Micropterus salmoides TaxID=27706 RepID=UPI0018EB10BB|nr:high affinity immunoglobulin gamma Fc receptor I-like [Micropterus salmoides]
MMEVKALCTRLLLKVLLLLAALVHQSYTHKGNAAFLRIVPTRLQFFEYETISFFCEGFDGSAKWRGVRNIDEFIPTCSNSTVTSTLICVINNAFVSDSGEYWCDVGGGEGSNTVNITVTAGSVILKSPVFPVMEGGNVSLQCVNKKTPLKFKADFYKNGLQILTGYSGNMTIHNVSKTDEGLYKCNISGAGESPESWLAVTIKSEQASSVILESPVLPVMEGDAVTLNCRNTTTSINLPAVFYKDGLFIGSSSTGNMTIPYVYKSHEGLYKCNISGAGESQESWLAVRALHRAVYPCSDRFVFLVLLLRTVFTILMVPLLLLLVGLLHCGKLKINP